MADPFIRPLSSDARILIEFEGRPLERYAIMLQLQIEGRWQTTRLFDNAHGGHDMHRYTGGDKQPAERFAEGVVNEVAPQAINYLIDHGKQSRTHGEARAQQIHRSGRDRQRTTDRSCARS